MPISDAYVVEYLLQATRAPQQSLVWKSKESEGFASTLRGVQVDLCSIATRTRSYLCLSLTDGEDTIFIQEPPQTAFFRVKYATEDDRRLACLMKELSQAIAGQLAAREDRRASIVEITRQVMYRRVIGTLEPEA
jgi:hypothetical protein